jgi:hypothetical protein
MFSIVPFSVTLASTAAQLVPVSLSTSFCGSMNTIPLALLDFHFIVAFFAVCERSEARPGHGVGGGRPRKDA